MFYRLIVTFTFSLFLLLSSFIITPPVEALVQIKITDVSYKDCPPGVGEGSVTSGGSALPATCYLVTGKTNNTSGKTLYDADVFGRVYDANNEPALQNRTRLGALPEVPPGISSFELRISVPSNQPTPLKLKQFKATGFTSKVYPTF
ncbi:hypothetical protein VKI21_07670 [Cyanobacterium aponinum UTEX 3222]|uniref:Biotin carboxylase n=3 Tax=Cyanobacterium aponinum TaxID=379064 RepID=K9Z7E7_CYAAP|nr:hypothetical protein [Cyanobacterium aponinum]WRL43553.1 hypothetical protein VKI21_07670 [Cyanobacterium aponinum UTEX 3222]AFZ54500.1 hypothetical protein Cyan10605_2418 [Cyanobacterium aponinum PCC 10605]MTF40146.1 hypothetical protein [Cyanobacterium aponinum 0216]PHV61361.1 hypothetical protein CSQ80_15930 [Cyanobacterium aponinum IPPAS B-1201]WPF88099.1 hypothetical protein SAY89_15040 [Cyanobacterium aponinum AL20115]